MPTSCPSGTAEATGDMRRPARIRRDVVRELLDAAERQLASSPVSGVSLRAVARDVGITVQSVYHYFRSRDELLVALVERSDAVLAGRLVAASAAEPMPVGQALVACRMFHTWALGEPQLFRLVFGDRRRAGQAASASRVLTSVLSRVALCGQDGVPAHPCSAARRVTRAWAELYGLVALEVVGLLDPYDTEQSGLFADACARIVVELDGTSVNSAGLC